MWENLLIPGLEGLELSRVLSNISLGDLQAAVAAAEKEVAAMELELATLEKAEEVAQQRAKQAVSFAGLDAGDAATKAQLYSRLKKLQAKKIKLGGKINSIRLSKIPSIIDFMTGETKKIDTRPYSSSAAHDWFDKHIDMIPEDERELFREDNLPSQSAMDMLMLLDEGYTPEEVVKKVKARVVKLRDDEDKAREQEQGLAKKKNQEKEQMREPAGVVFSNNAEVVPVGF